MTAGKFIVECVGCNTNVTAAGDDQTRCPSCGTRYAGTTVVSSPLPGIDAGDTGLRVDTADDTVEPTPEQPEATASVERAGGAPSGSFDINLNLNVQGDDE